MIIGGDIADRELEEVINSLRIQLRAIDYAYGALFVGHKSIHGHQWGLVFVKDMPNTMRLQMLDDLQEALNAARKRFQV